MKHISSRDNPDYRRLMRAVAGKQAPGERSKRRREIALEGVHLCQSWLQSEGQPWLGFFDAERTQQPEIADLMARVQAERIRLCTRPLLRAASQVAQGQGVIFLAEAPDAPTPTRINMNCLWLDRIQDPGNMGTLLRTAVAAGLRHVFASIGCTDAWSAKVLRSAQGAHFLLNIHEGVDLLALSERLDIPLIATSLEDSESLYESRLPGAAAWVFGNEGQGIAPKLLGKADRRLRIPLAPDVESLNVAVAAGICLFEQRRQAAMTP